MMMTIIRNVAGSPVLVLNQNYEPVNVTNVRRAVTLVMSSKAEVLEAGEGRLNSPSTSVQCPSVIRLQYIVRRPDRRIPLTRRAVFLRDNYTCQYCGKRGHELTLDHVMPRSRGGTHTWDNLVSACGPCNHKKGPRTLEQARMHLRSAPREPRPSVYTIVRRFAPNGELVAGWEEYLPG